MEGNNGNSDFLKVESMEMLRLTLDQEDLLFRVDCVRCKLVEWRHSMRAL